MKRISKVFILSMLMNMASASAFASDFEVNGICYNIVSISDLTCEIAPGYYSGDFVVPDEVQYNGNTLKVIQIGKNAFKESSITSITIPSGITTIDDYAFYECKKMEEISIPNTVRYIGDTSFWGCSSLTSISLPSSVSLISRQAFAYCTSLTEIIIPEGIKEISDYTFRGCSSLKNIVLPNSLTRIGESAFEKCSSIESIDIPQKLEEIGEAAFMDCASLSSFTIPASCVIVKNYAFNGCESLSKLVIEDCNTEGTPLVLGFGYVRDDNAKYYTDLFSDLKLETLYLGRNVRRGIELLRNNGEGFRAYGNMGLFGRWLKSITIGNMVTDEIYEGDVWYFLDYFYIGNYHEVYLPIKHITFGKLITQIPDIPSHDLDSLVVFNANPPIAEGFTNKTYIDCKLYVPNGCKEKYMKDDVWKNFWNIYEMEYGESPEDDEPTDEPTAGKLLFASNVSTYKGKQVALPVSLSNEQTIAGFQFDLQLPTGVSVAKSGNNYLASLSSRASGLDISVSKLESSNYRFVAFSNEANNITGSSGEVLTITLDIPSTATIGESTITIKNVVLTAIVNETSQSVYADNAISTLTVQDFTLGDPNNDGFINVTDVAGIVTHVLGQSQTNFTEVAADVNSDGVVDDNDVTAEINTVKSNATVGTGESSGKLLYGNALSGYKGKQVVLPIILKNTQAITGYQFDLQLPTGISLVTNGAALTDRASGLTIFSNTLGTNQYRFVVVSTAGNTIAAGEAAVMNLTLNVTDGVATGENTIAISNVVLTAKSGNNVSSIYSDQANITLTIGSYSLGDVNGDDYINVTDVVCMVYDILGQTQAGFIRIAADINGDGEVNITDVTAVVAMILAAEGKAAARTRSVLESESGGLKLTNDGDGALSLHVDAPDNYMASQMEIHLAEGQMLKNVVLNNQYKDSHQLVYDKVGKNCYRILIFSMGNEAYPTDDELIKISVTGSGGDVEVREAVMVTSQKEQRFYDPISIYQPETATELVDIYSTDGRLIKSQAKDTSGLRKGVYIIKGKKVIVK